MRAIETGTRLVLKNFLFLTDFSEPSELAIPFAVSLAREYEAKLYALHVLTAVPLAHASPESAATAIAGVEEGAQAEMQRLDSQLAGVTHETIMVRGDSVWFSIDKMVAEREIDLVILGTHGRTGAMKLLLGSVAEEIFRRATIPVLTIGPAVRIGTHSGGRFHRVLYATDFTPEAQAAAPYAISMAQENQARLFLLHVMRDPRERRVDQTAQDSVANVMHELYEIVPQSAEIWCRPEATVRFGPVANRILDAAKELEADLIVLGVRDPGARMGAATHLERTTAHKIVAHAACPVLTIRGQNKLQTLQPSSA
jgi:nucleotide-binding universal stress UspA family protein